MLAFVLCGALISILVINPTLGLTNKPNFVFVIADDLRFIDPYNDPLDVMPRLKAMISAQSSRGGAVFLNAHTQMAMCTPSRCSFLTGLRPDTTKVYEIHDIMRKSKAALTTIPEGLKKAGYTTVGIGKIFDGRSVGGWKVQDYPYSWSEPVNSRQAAVSNHNASMTDCGYGDTRYNSRRNPMPFSQCVEVVESKNYSLQGLPDEDLKNIAIAKLNELSANPGTPFFLAVGYLRPHLPIIAPQKHYARWPRSLFLNYTQYPYTIGRDSIFQPVAYRNTEVRDYSDWPVPVNKKSIRVPIEVHARAVHSYLAAASFVDEMFGDLIDALDEQPSAVKDNTYIFFTGDHGFHLGEHEFYAKKTVYEKATKVPLLMLGPKSVFPSIVKVEAPVEMLDFAPTIFELAGLASPYRRGFQGSSLVPYARASNRVSRTKAVALSQFFAFGMYRSSVMSYSLRGQRYRFVAHYDKEKHRIIHIELYDYVNDPSELLDVSKHPANADALRNLWNLFTIYLQSIPDYNSGITNEYLNLDV